MLSQLIKILILSTAVFSCIVAKNKVFAQPLSGTYLVGPGEYFETLSAVSVDLFEFGIDGPVIFNIQPGIYDEQLEINTVVGASEINTITFQSIGLDSSTVIIQNEPPMWDDNIVRLWGVNYIHFKHLTFKVIGEENNSIFRCYGMHHSSITHCAFLGVTDESGRIIKYTNESGIVQESLTISNNLFKDGAIVLEMDGLWSDVEISNNIFDGAQSQFMELDDISNLTISNNLFMGTTSLGSVEVNQCDSNFVFQDNVFPDLAHIAFYNIGGSPTSISKIINNSIVGRIALFDVQYMDFLHNSINTFGLPESPCISLSGSDFFHLNFYNNILVHQNAGRILYATEHFFGAMFDANNNCYYSTMDKPFVEKVSGTTVSRDLEEWSEDKFSDFESLFTYPNYISDTDLHIDNASAINNMGMPLPEVALDFDSEIRDTETPDIGADEFEIDSATYRDIEINAVLSPLIGCIANDSIIIQVKNNSIFEMNTFTIKWYLFEGLMDSTYYTLTIPTGDSISIYLANFNFIPNTGYKFRFEVYNPNDQYDHYFDNNIYTKQLYWLEDVTIFKSTDVLCSGETELYIKNFPRSSVLWNTGASEDQIFILDPGEYSILITDEGGCEYSDSILIDE